MSIDVLLLDADGVIQTTADTFFTDIKALVGSSQAEVFIQQVFDSERPALTGKGDFRVDLSDLLSQWKIKLPVDEVLSYWHKIHLVPGTEDLLGKFRRAGLKVCLTTNQQQYRMDYMRNQMQLDKHFDSTFYSCELGAAKPSSEYFQIVLQRLEVSATSVLFVDDNLANVEAARGVGIRAEHYEVKAPLSSVGLEEIVTPLIRV